MSPQIIKSFLEKKEKEITVLSGNHALRLMKEKAIIYMIVAPDEQSPPPP
jgi:hypothetical protein